MFSVWTLPLAHDTRYLANKLPLRPSVANINHIYPTIIMFEQHLDSNLLDS